MTSICGTVMFLFWGVMIIYVVKVIYGIVMPIYGDAMLIYVFFTSICGIVMLLL